MAIMLSQIRAEADLDASKYAAGAKVKTDADAQMVQGAEKVAAGLDVAERKLGTSGTAYEKLARSIDPAYLAQQRLVAGTSILQGALDNGTISAQRHAELVDILQKRYADIASGQAGFNQNLKANAAALDALRGSLDPVYRSQQLLASGTAVLNNALKDGLIDANTHVQLFQRLSGQYSQLGSQATASGEAIGRSSNAFRTGSEAASGFTSALSLNRQGLQELQAAGINSFQALSSGMSVWRVAQTEAAQVLGAFVQGGAISFRTILGWGGILIGLAATSALVAARFLEIGANIRSFSVSLSTIASGSTASAEGLQSLVEHLRATGTAAADAKKAVDTVLQAGPSGVNTSLSSVTSIVELGRDIGAARGTGIAEVGTLTTAIGGGIDALIKYGLQLNAIHPLEAQEIKDLSERGRQADAVNLAVSLLAALYSGKYQESLSDSEKATIRIKNAWDDLLDTLARSGIVDYTIEQIKKMIGDISELASSIKGLVDIFKTLSSAIPAGAQAATTAATRAQSDLADALRQRGIEAGQPFTNQQLGAILGDQSVALKPTPSLTGGGLLDRVIGSLVQTESGGIQSRISNKGAIGLTQLLPGTAADLGVNPYDPAQNLAGGTQYLLQQTQRFGSLQAGLQAYNWGPGNYQNYLRGYNQLPASVSAYSSGILRSSGATGQETALQLSGANGINYSAPTSAQTVAVQDYTKANAELLAVQKEFIAKSVEVQAKLDAERIIREKSLSGLDAENVMSDALATAKQRLANEAAKVSTVSQMEADGQTRITEAYGKSEAAGLRQVAIENARVAALNTGADAQKVATDALVLQADKSVAAAQMQSRSFDQQVAASQRLADASAHGTAALQDAQIHNEALAATYNALNEAQAAYDQALTTGDDALKASTKATLDKADALTRAKEAQLAAVAAFNQTEQVNQITEQAKNTAEQLNLQIGLQGKTTQEIQGQVQQLQLKQDLEGRFSKASDEAKDHLREQTDALVQTNIKLAEARAAQQRLDEEVRSIADTVINTLGTAIDDVLSGKKITDWGTLFKDMLRSIASTVIQSEIVKPLIGSVLQSAGLTQAAQQYGTVGQGGGLFGGTSILGNIGSLLGGVNTISGSGGLLGGIGGLFGGGAAASAIPGTATLLAAPATEAIGTGLVSSTALGAGAADAAAGGLFGGLGGAAGIAGLASAAIPVAGAVIAGVTLLTSVLGNKKPSNNAGGLSLDLSSGGISGASGNQANLGVAQQIGSSLATFEQQLLAKIPGATLPGGGVNIQKGDVTGITTDYSGPLGHIKASFGSAQEAINAFSVAIAKDLGGIGDTLKQTLSTVTDPSQIQAAIDVANAYDKVKDAAGGAAKELSGAYDDLFKNITADSIRSIGPFESVLNQINDRFNQLTQTASQYGLSLDPINVGYKAAKDRLAADFNTTIAQALQALKDPAQAAVDAEKKAGDQRVVDAKAVGADLAAVEQYNEANLKKYTDAATKSLDDAAKSYANFTASITTSFASITSNVGQQAGTFEKALVSVNDNFKNLAQQAIAAGNATDDITHNAIVSRGLITQSFNASIADLMQTITDPVQEAIDVEARAGQARVREAIAVNGDLDAVNRYNAVNLQKVAATAATATNNALQQVLSNASATLSATLSNVTVAVKGPFEDALDALYKTFGDLTTAAKAANASSGDLTSLVEQLGHSLESLRQSFNTNIQALSLALTNPFQAALDAELAAGRKRVADAVAVGGDLAAVDEYNRRSLLAVAQAAADATNAITTAASYNKDIAQQIITITDPIQAAFNAELDAGRARVAAAQRVGADLAQVDELNRLKLLQVATAIQTSTDALAKFTGRLQNLQAALGQLTSGPLSGLTPAQQVQSSTSSFNTLLARVKGGNLDLIPDLTQAGTAAVQSAQAAYGNAKQTADIRERITSALFDVSTQTGREAAIAAESTTITAANKAQVKSDLDAQAASLRAIADSASGAASAEASIAANIAAQLTTQVQTQEQIATADAARAGLAGALLKHDTEIATRTAAVANNIGTIEEQTAYLAAAGKQAVEAATRVVVAVPDTIAYRTAAAAATPSAASTAAAAPAPSAAVAPNALRLPSLEVSVANLWAQYNALSAGMQATYNTVVGTTPDDYNPPDKLPNKITLVALLSEYQSLSPTLRNVYDSIVSANHDFYNNTLWGIANKWSFIAGTVAPLAAAGYASGTTSTEAGWIRVGERGPELIHQGGGNTVLPNGVLPVANDNSGLIELRALREEVAALRRQIQGGQAQASRDASAIVGETANVGRAIARTPVARRVVA